MLLTVSFRKVGSNIPLPVLKRLIGYWYKDRKLDGLESNERGKQYKSTQIFQKAGPGMENSTVMFEQST